MTRRSNLKPASGTLREERFPPALDPASARVDEHTREDLMAFALDFSRLLNFYDSSNETIPEAWWRFFARDLSFLLAHIVTTDFQRDRFRGWAFQNDLKRGRGNVREILRAIYTLARRMDDWYRWAGEVAKANREDNRFRKALESIIKTDIRYYLGKHIEAILQELPAAPGQESWPALWARWEAGLHSVWRVEEGDEHAALVAQYPRPTDGLLSVLRAFHRANSRVARVAEKYLGELLTRSDHPPQTALYICFINLFLQLQEKINNITARHLDFYYGDVLQLSRRPSVPDVAHVCFNLAPELKSYKLLAGTLLSAGKDPGGKPIEYAADEDLFINQARIASLKALYLAYATGVLAHQKNQRVTSIFALPQVNSQDGRGEALKLPERGWPTFGINEATHDDMNVSTPQAELGFVVASSLLLLQEGDRNVIATLAFAGDGALEAALQRYQGAAAKILDAPPPVENLLADAFLVYVSGEAGWIPVRNPSFRRHPVVGTTMEIEYTFRPADPAILPNSLLAPAADGGDEWPLLKLVLNPHARVYASSFFDRLEITEIEFRVSVRGVQKLQLRNELGPVDPAQPFPVLGPIVLQGSYLLLNHRELNVKPVDHVTLSFTWFNLPAPPATLESYYAGYGLGIRDDSFKLRITILSDRGWQSPADGQDLFPMFARDYDRSGGLLPVTVIAAQLPEITLPEVSRPAPPVLSEADAPLGTLRLELVEPAFGFGHQVFPGLMAEAAIKNSKAGKNGPQHPLPNPPLAPFAKAVMLDYDAAGKLDLTRPLPASQKAHFYSLYPFGYLDHRGRATTIFPSFAEQGHLYMGISQAGPREPVTLLIQICDTAFSPIPSLRNHRDEAVPSIRWRYLSQYEWKELPARLLLSDSTMGLTRSGIVKLSLPEDISSRSTLMPAGVCWIEAAARRVAGVYWSRIVSVDTQAVSATRVCDPQNDLIRAVTPAGAITQLSQKQPQIKVVRQPFASSGGRSRESLLEFRTRVSERLRHKDRAIQAVDFEKMVLDRFPEVGQVKCIGYNQSRFFPGTAPVEPGALYLVVTPRLEDTSDHEPRLPQYRLKNIESYIRSHVSRLIEDIHVINPVYETLKVFATVEFSLEGDGTGYSDDLDAALSVYLQPWRGKPVKPMPIGSGQLQSFDVALFIQQQPYVNRVHSLTMLHTYQTETGYRSRWIDMMGAQRAREPRVSASAPWAVLIPAPHHSIVPVDPDDKDNIDQGIRNLSVGSDFVMSQEEEEEKKEDAHQLRYFLVVPARPEHGNPRR